MTTLIAHEAGGYTETTGTGSLLLTRLRGTATPLEEALARTDAFYYRVEHDNGLEWEVGIGAVPVVAPAWLTRTTVLLSSNSNSAVDFSAGRKVVRPCTAVEVQSYLRIPTTRIAAGVPTGAPVAGENGIAFDSTATTGGLYVWSGSAWVKAATIP